eukprot:TRINITY_DN465_c1_g1_i4.p1 TRINITY_DN465_c1_g1~~TRINITY_DN465_c1_g1_i4.p1  ORF type:complete len:1124 (+),score=390.92 TRINITY_DN465_c1_g1_i4:174-3545(+)
MEGKPREPLSDTENEKEEQTTLSHSGSAEKKVGESEITSEDSSEYPLSDQDTSDVDTANKSPDPRNGVLSPWNKLKNLSSSTEKKKDKKDKKEKKEILKSPRKENGSDQTFLRSSVSSVKSASSEGGSKKEKKEKKKDNKSIDDYSEAKGSSKKAKKEKKDKKETKDTKAESPAARVAKTNKKTFLKSMSAELLPPPDPHLLAEAQMQRSESEKPKKKDPQIKEIKKSPSSDKSEVVSPPVDLPRTSATQSMIYPESPKKTFGMRSKSLLFKSQSAEFFPARSETPPRNNDVQSDEGDGIPDISDAAVKESIYLAQTQFFFDVKPFYVYSTLLGNLMHLTKSTYGLLGTIREKPNKVYIKIRVVLDRDVGNAQKSTSRITNLDSLVGSVVVSRETLRSTSPEHDPRGPHGIPNKEKTQLLHTMMVVPLLSGPREKMLAIIVVANRSEGYSVQNTMAVAPLLKTCGNLMEAHLSHQNIKLKESESPKVNDNRHRSISDSPRPGGEDLESEQGSDLRSNTGSYPGEGKRAEKVAKKTHSPFHLLRKARKEIENDLEYFGFRKRAETQPGTPTGKPAATAVTKAQTQLDLLMDCVKNQDARTLRKLMKLNKFHERVNDMDGNNQTLLHVATKENAVECVEILIESGADVNARDDLGYTALHLSSELDHNRITLAMLNNPRVDPNMVNNGGSTPFHAFCSACSSPVVLKKIFEAFVARNTDINAQDKINGETPLHKAILNRTVRVLIVRLLLEQGVNVNNVNSKGDSPLHYSVRVNRKELVDELILANADITLQNKQEQTALDVAVEEHCADTILNLLLNTQDLFNWFEKMKLTQYVPIFVKENIFRDVLHLVDEKVLTDMGITKAGDRMRILAAIDEIKARRDAKNVPSGRARPARKALIPQPVAENDADIKKKLLDMKDVTWLKYTSFEFTKQLSAGSSGQVYKGFYNGEEIAIKVLEKQSSDQLQGLKHEIKILSAVTGPHIVNFLGACIEPKLCLAMEFCSRGSLYDILTDNQLQFGWKEVFIFAKQMMLGLQTLHNFNPQILHRDVKSMNFLVAENWCIKVCDFGLARASTGSNMSTLMKLRGTMCYLAPETCKGEQYSAASDIYSYGVCLWEIVYRLMMGR